MKLFFGLLLLVIITVLGFSRCQKQTVPPIITTDTLYIHDTTLKVVHDSVVRTLTLKPGPDDGKDILVGNLPPYAGVNLKGNPDISASQWTYNAQGYSEGTTRTYIEFEALDGLPDSAYIRSAQLTFYGMNPGTGSAAPEGNSFYPGSPYSGYVDNSCWLKKVTGNWDLDGITWNNMPGTTDLDKIAIPASTTQWNYNVTVDVTQLVQDIVTTHQNYGFSLQQQNEEIYRSLNFAGSRNADSTRWPKLVINYSAH